MVVAYIWDDALLAGPVVAVTSRWGAWKAFLTMTPLYFVASLAITLVLLRVVRTPHGPSRWALWVDHQADRPGRRWVRRAAQTGSVIGFVVSSVFLGGIVTTMLFKHVNPQVRPDVLAIVSCALFAVAFVSLYSGATRAVVALWR